MNLIKSLIVWITALCYLLVLFPVNFFIWLIALPFDRKRDVIHYLLSCQCLILIRLLPVWKVKIEGRKKAVKGATYVIISNHQSLLDILFLNSLRYRFKWISKIEMAGVPMVGWYLKMAGYIMINRGNEESKVEMMERSLKCLRNGTSIMIFPEGTRSSDGNIGFFKRGAFQLAIEAQVPVLPVMIDGTGDILPRHGYLLGGGHRIILRVFDPVYPSSFTNFTAEEMALKFSTFMTSELEEIRLRPDK